jgi:energy-coupling factor transporter ATP-binding protein EcfA2
MVNWSAIRVWNNSQNNAFEELVCQLARAERFEKPTTYRKVGNPDGGVECYHTFEDGYMYGWQAKHFYRHTDIKTSQWSQIFKSFKTALKEYPQLVRYYVCLPVDLTVKRSEYEKQQEKWRQYAIKQGRDVTFEFWGSAELLDRLSHDAHAGRRRFWFNETEFTPEWFATHISRTMADLEKMERFSPHRDVDLDIEEYVDALLHTEYHKKRIEETFANVLSESRFGDTRWRGDPQLLSTIEAYDTFFETLRALFPTIQAEGKLLPSERQRIVKQCKQALTSIENTSNALRNQFPEPTEQIRNQLSTLWTIDKRLSEFDYFMNGRYVAAAHLPCVIVTGAAGSGKSHLLAKAVKKAIQHTGGTIFLLGHHFSTREVPWTQILNNILQRDLPAHCSPSEFLGALSAYAEARGKRLLIAIDALNEGEGKSFWGANISGFIHDITKYENLVLLLSVRDTYEDAILPKDKTLKDKALKVWHEGFGDLTDQAVQAYFLHYGITLPRTPLLNPEFSNPLFLKVFCSALEKSGHKSIPAGFHGLYHIISEYCHAVDIRLTESYGYEYAASNRLVIKVVIALARGALQQDKSFIPRNDAQRLVNEIVAEYTHKKTFLDDLMHEGIVFSTPAYTSSGYDYDNEVIGFTYDRFEDYFKALELCRQYPTAQDLTTALQDETSTLYTLFFSEKNHIKNTGILEILSIILPECHQIELHEAVPVQYRDNVEIAHSFIDSLKWRNTQHISSDLRGYINEIIRYETLHRRFLDSIYANAGKADHPFGAHFLHRNLIKWPLADRDAQWTTVISSQYEGLYSANRLLHWLLHNNYNHELSEDIVISIGLAVGWLFTSTNRTLRDEATKALIALYEGHLEALPILLKAFEGVNDPYVYERLYAVAYGSAVGSTSQIGLAALAQYVYDAIFDQEEVYPHILLRDYARNVIEWAVHSGIALQIDLSKIRPPYRSTFSQLFPSNKEIDEKYGFDYRQITDSTKNRYGQEYIICSMTTEYGRGTCMYGDFGRYVFQSKISDWSKHFTNLQLLSNQVIAKIMEEYGYDIEKHGWFDINLRSHGRDPQKIERIGKKYQWMAMHDLLARLADNFTKQDRYDDEPSDPYQGSWNPFIRDIDPTILKLPNKEQAHWSDMSVSNAIWSIESDEVWVDDDSNLPAYQEMLFFQDDAHTKWIALYHSPFWEQKRPVDAEKYGWSGKNIWYNFVSMIVPNQNIEALNCSLQEQSGYDTLRPRVRTPYQMYQGELYWSPAYKAMASPDYEGIFSRNIQLQRGQSIQALDTTESLHFEGNDFSYEGYTSCKALTADLFHSLGLQRGERWGELQDEFGNVACFDPSCHYESKSKLLIRRDILSEYLRRHDSSIVWIFQGRKVLGSHEQAMLDLDGHFIFDGQCFKEQSMRKSSFRPSLEIL